ncbi:MAG: 30S ribosome-binding factor RbfA [Acidobacteria bacterium]|nr:30S ribosome-binding factor RbfA [Acidobacteriota bacterium]
MTVPGRRPQRVGQRILEEISELLAGELKDPRIGFATITGVRVTPDLRQAFVFVSVLGSADEQRQTLEGLCAAKAFIRHELAERLQIRRVPELSFTLDRGPERAAHIEELLRQARGKPEPPEEP